MRNEAQGGQVLTMGPVAARRLCVLMTVMLFASAAWGQGDVYSSGSGANTNSNQQTYQDEFSTNCSQGNTSPFAAMDPMTCHGVMMPPNSRGECQGDQGWQFLQRKGGSCYFCQPLAQPIVGIIIPYDQLRWAGRLGFKCGVDQADPNCKAICTKDGSTQYSPPPRSGNDPLVCAVPDWVRGYQAEGASPPLRYQVGFNQGVATCLQNQCTVQNLAVAVFAAAFPKVRALLGVAQAVGAISAVVNPPGFSPSPDPYTRGRQEGERLCNWMLRIAIPARAGLGPLVGAGGKINIPRGFNAREAIATLQDWLPNINPSGCQRNCGLSTLNSVRVLFGQPFEPASPTTQGMTEAQMEAGIGKNFFNTPLTDVDLYQFLNRLPDGTVAVLSGENPNYSGSTPSGPLTDPNQIPGHFFFSVKSGNALQFWDGQAGGEQAALPGGYIYRWMVVGNPTQP